MSYWSSVGRLHGYKCGDIVNLSGKVVKVLAVGFDSIEVEDIQVYIRSLEDKLADKQAKMEDHLRIQLDLENKLRAAEQDYREAMNRMEIAAMKLGAMPKPGY